MTREHEERALESCDTGQATEGHEFAETKHVTNDAVGVIQSILSVGPDSIVAELDASFAGRVRALMQDNLAENHTLEQVCERLALKTRELQRLLADEGTSFSAILDDEREKLAKHHLEQDAELPAISALLGFSHVSGFYRAYRRWTGSTPAAYRRECRRGRREQTPDVA